MVKIGNKAPNFKAKNQNGELIELKKLRGKKVILFFYPKDDTPACTAEACNLRDNYLSLVKKGFEVIGISTDDEKKHLKFISKHNLPYNLISDIDKKVHELYGTWAEKMLYGRKYMGTLRTTFIIDENGKLIHIIEKVNTKNHTEQILDLVQ